MTVKELSDKLLQYPNQNAEISIGCNTDYGYCLRTNCESEFGNIFLCDKPEYCDDYMMSNSEIQEIHYLCGHSYDKCDGKIRGISCKECLNENCQVKKQKEIIKKKK